MQLNSYNDDHRIVLESCCLRERVMSNRNTYTHKHTHKEKQKDKATETESMYICVCVWMWRERTFLFHFIVFLFRFLFTSYSLDHLRQTSLFNVISIISSFEHLKSSICYLDSLNVCLSSMQHFFFELLCLMKNDRDLSVRWMNETQTHMFRHDQLLHMLEIRLLDSSMF